MPATADKPITLRNDADVLEKSLLEAHGVLNDLLGAVPSKVSESEQQLDGYIYQLTSKCETNCVLAANLLLRLTDLRNRI